MFNKLLITLVFGVVLVGCKDKKTNLTGQACLGINNDTLVESIQNQCKAGDIIATKHPAYFCDFSYSVAYNQYNSAICVYTGKTALERVSSIK